MMRWIIIVCTLVFLITDVIGQDTLYIGDHFESAWVGTYTYLYEDASVSEEISDILEKPEEVWERQSNIRINKGVSASNFWLRFPLKNEGNAPATIILVLENHSIERLMFYCYDDGQQQDHSMLMGDILPFHNREIKHRHFSYKIQIPPKKSLDIYCMAGKIGGRAFFPLKAYHPNSWQAQSNNNYIFHGFIFGLFFILLIIGFFILIIKRALFTLFFFLEYLFVLLNIGNTTGFGFQYIWSEFTLFRQIASPLTISIALFFKTLFIIYYFQTKKHKLSHKILKIASAGFLTTALIVMLTALFSNYIFNLQQGGIVIGFFVYATIVSGTLLNFIALLLLYQSSKSKSVLIYTIPSFIHIIIGILAILMYYFPIIIFSYNRDLIILASYFFEGLIIILAVGLDYDTTKTANEKLEVELIQKKAEALQNLLQGQETERKRLSRELHDGLSIRLAQIKNSLTQSNGISNGTPLDIPHLIQSVDNVHQDIRNFSHALNPTVLHDFGLQEAINDIIYNLELHREDLDIEFNYSADIRLVKAHEKHFYHIIQELLHNTDKYAKASSIKIDLEGTDEGVEFSYFDDGIPFAPHSKTKGIGLKNIKSRVDLMHGVFEIKPIFPKGKTQIIKVLY